ncbi:DNA-directed RNA polymerase specialized sigma subunit [Halarchaeum rubridurum]|uniref:DNA-directed RNA polymerase specialized sigma subunit n=1 Tax=Halarchaeum rubridurum TaxID=489911 RepID=A0A8T4GLC0_9EURY|nr:DUF5805 domain-containing protein [Halarchaeum rubridurum]MBP1953451.1 DNA-directed RNA polymerase specialized sigma subunit [Halarchaeum rubridurum]
MSDDERVSVKTYVPRYQKAAWVERAEEMGVSQSEFVRLMVQAGVRELGLDADGNGDGCEADTGGEDAGPSLEQRVLDELRERDVAGWETLVDALAGDFEERLEGTLDDLAERGVVKYSPRDGGYVLREADE